MGKYDSYSEEELRSLFFKGELSAELMTEEDYTALYQQELDLEFPDDEIIDFCFTGLSKFPKYSDISEQNFDIDEVLDEVYNRQIAIKRLVRVMVGLTAAILAVITLQVVCLAFGFDLFDYIINRNKEEVVSVLNPSLSEAENNGEDYIVATEYVEIEEIPNDVIELIPRYMFENFDFLLADCYLSEEIISIFAAFSENDDSILALTISQLLERQIEKDDNGYYETFIINGVSYDIHTNMGDYQAFWIKDGFVYSLHTSYQEIEKLKSLLENLY
ncbi:MAG: DUF4367 domain-containing protein [Oscillospiraceae bacterium]|nr:DUF4367 domain-containing protein [Oscillospiraceae bacterium]